MSPGPKQQKRKGKPNGDQKQPSTVKIVQETSGKRVQSYCLRYSLRVMEKHAKEQQLSITATLLLSIGIQTEEIINRVRKRLREEAMPSSYLKAEDPVAENMHQSNRQRRTEIESNQEAVDTLERQLATSKEHLHKTKRFRDQAKKRVSRIQKQEAAERKAEEEELEPGLLAAISFRGDSLYQDHSYLSGVRSIGNLPPGVEYQRAPRGTMADLLHRLS